MKTFLFGAVAAVGLALGAGTQDASAHWEVRKSMLWDPVLGAYVPAAQRVWVPDPVVVEPTVVYSSPAPLVVTPPVVVRPIRIGHHRHHPHPIFIR